MQVQNQPALPGCCTDSLPSVNKNQSRISKKSCLRSWSTGSMKRDLTTHICRACCNCRLNRNFFKLVFTPCKTEQPLQGMELQEKKKKRMTWIWESCLERGQRKKVFIKSRTTAI